MLSHGELHLRSAEMDHRIVVFEHVHFFNVIKRLHAYLSKETRFSQGINAALLTKLLDRGLDLLVFLDSRLSARRHLLLNAPLSTYAQKMMLERLEQFYGAMLTLSTELNFAEPLGELGPRGSDLRIHLIF